MKSRAMLCFAIALFLSCGEYTPTEPGPFTAEVGYWTGLTGQDRSISFYTTSSRTMGDIVLKIGIPDAPTVTCNIAAYEEYGDEGSWSRDVVGVSLGGDTHTVFIQGLFIASDSCVGDFTAESETYYGGYSVQSNFTVSPDQESN